MNKEMVVPAYWDELNQAGYIRIGKRTYHFSMHPVNARKLLESVSQGGNNEDTL